MDQDASDQSNISLHQQYQRNVESAPKSLAPVGNPYTKCFNKVTSDFKESFPVFADILSKYGGNSGPSQARPQSIPHSQQQRTDKAKQQNFMSEVQFAADQKNPVPSGGFKGYNS
jgi:hypothetical protein